MTPLTLDKPKTPKETILGPPSKVVRGPRIKGATPEDLKNLPVIVLLYGIPGSGKSHAVAQLVLQGKKAFVLITDAGGENAINTIKAVLYAAGKDDTFISEHLRWFFSPIGDGREAVSELLQWLKKPDAELWDFDPDFLFWDGFSNYQAQYIQDDFDDDDGGIANFKDWGKISTHTIRDCSYLFQANNPRTNKVIHKVLSCLEGLTDEKKQSGVDNHGKPIYDIRVVNSGRPLLKTKVSRLFAASFDLSLRLVIEEDGKYMYYTETKTTQDGKKRIILPAKMPANFNDVWAEVEKQLHL